MANLEKQEAKSQGRRAKSEKRTAVLCGKLGTTLTITTIVTDARARYSAERRLFFSRHGQPFRTTPVHRSRRPDPCRQKHAVPGDCRNLARPAHQRARAQSFSAAVLRRRARSGLPGAVRVPYRALRTAWWFGCEAQSQQDLRRRLHLRKGQAVCLPQPR